jgi:Domain of unknown function (DUF1844)
MSEPPKFTVIDRRKMKAEEESDSAPVQASAPEVATEVAPEPTPTPSAGPRLVVSDDKPAARPEPDSGVETPELDMPPAPSAQQSHEQKQAYDASAQRLEELIRAQNPGVGAQPPISFEHLVQQFYVSAMIQMGAGTQEGQQPRVDILGARTTIDMLGILAEKTRGNLNASEDQMLQSVLFELRMAFLELTSMINMQSVPPPPPPAKR